MRKINVFVLLFSLVFVFISCSDKSPYIEIKQIVEGNYKEFLKEVEPLTYQVKTYIWLKGIEGYGDIIEWKKESVACEQIPKTKEDQMVWALKLKEKYEINIKNIPKCKNL